MVQPQSQPSSNPSKPDRTVESVELSPPDTPQHDAQEREQGQQPGTSHLEYPTKEQRWQRWREVQTDFVDDPRKAVAEAHRLVGEVIQDIVHRFESERAEFERGWSRSDGVSTEDLRCAVQRYRDFFDRLLAMEEHG